MLKDGDTNICEGCKSECVVNDLKGFIVCRSCGLIKEDRFVNQSSEYRYFNDDNGGRSDPRRVGNSVNIFMDSQIDLIEIGDFGKKNYMTYSLQSNADKAYTRALKLIKRYCDCLDLPFLQKQAEEIYFEVKDKKELKGKRMETTIAAIIYLAGRKNKTHIQMQSLEPIADVSQKKIIKACNVILKLIPKIVERSHEYVKQFGSKLNLSKEIVIEMEKVCKEIENWDIFERRLPKHRTIAAAVLYLYSVMKPELNLNMVNIKEASGVSSDATIKKYYIALKEKKDALLRRALNEDNPDLHNSAQRLSTSDQ